LNVLFNSGVFVVFLLFFVPLFCLVRRDLTKRNVLLLISSYIFYGWWDARFLILVAVSTSVDFMAALGAAGKPVPWTDRLKSLAFLLATTLAVFVVTGLRETWLLYVVFVGLAALAAATEIITRHLPSEHQRRAWLFLSLVNNLGILAIFKYFNFFSGSLGGLLHYFGMHADFATLSIVLPVGLSFYTFQAISRTVDSYRGVFDPSRRLIDYAAFHAFFPQLVAGPIERARHLMPQFETVRPVDREMITTGALLFTWGLYKKIVIADNLAPIADVVFTGPSGHTAGAYLAAVLAFTFQIYCDFSGYSDMARGLARCLGFDLMVNFNLPYFSRTPSEFWRRWHISLSSWLRDYLYIPLGGNRGSNWRVNGNLMLTMLLGGLWHGASWTFVAWGGIHGAILVVYRFFDADNRLARTRPDTIHGAIGNVAAWLALMLLVMLTWIFFRAHSFGDAWTVLAGCFGTTGFEFKVFSPVLFYILPLIAVEIYQRFSDNIEFMARGPFVVRYTVAMSVVLAAVILSADGEHQFIYFDF
jgi:D-alanyl-lipoteichoic acid acyltransferase DltB (MBOAT superfamily)